MLIMKTYIFYLTTFTVILFLSACASTAPSTPHVVTPKSIKVKDKVVKVVDVKAKVTTTFHQENSTPNDATNRVFLDCFKTGKITLQKSCQQKIAKFLKSVPLKDKRNIFIEVHTDKAGSDKKNLLISKKRAAYVAKSLYYKEYKFSKVYFNGFGESKLIYDTLTPKANRANRRVVLKVRDKNTQVAKKYYQLYKKYKKVQKKKKAKRPTKIEVKQKQKKSLDILSYTGQADIGWIYFGKPSLGKKFTISCRDDKPRKVKRKAVSKSKKSEFTQGFYDKKIVGMFKGEHVEVYPVYLYENGKLPINNPTLLYTQKGQTIRLQTTVNAYRGKKGILYRIFVNGKKNISCMDIVFPYSKEAISYGRVYTQKNEYVFQPE